MYEERSQKKRVSVDAHPRLEELGTPYLYCSTPWGLEQRAPTFPSHFKIKLDYIRGKLKPLTWPSFAERSPHQSHLPHGGERTLDEESPCRARARKIFVPETRHDTIF